MAVLQMRKINICAMKKNRKKILEFLQKKGCLEIQETDNEDSVFEKMNTATQISIFERNAVLADNALEVLDRHCPENKSMFSALEGKKQIDDFEYQKSIENQQDIMNLVNKVLQLQKTVEEKEAAVIRCNEEIESLKPWLDLDVSMNYQGTRKTGFLIGSISGTYTQQGLIAKIEEIEEMPESVYVQVIDADKYQTYVTVVFMREQQEQVERALRELSFNRPPIITGHIPRVSTKKREDAIVSIKNEIESLKQDLAK